MAEVWACGACGEEFDTRDAGTAHLYDTAHIHKSHLERRQDTRPRLVACPSCGKEVSRVAAACPACGHPIAAPALPPKWNPGIAAVLSIVIPGAGQVYKGNFLGGLLWFLAVVAGYVLVIPGLILHFLCVLTAFTAGDPHKAAKLK